MTAFMVRPKALILATSGDDEVLTICDVSALDSAKEKRSQFCWLNRVEGSRSEITAAETNEHEVRRTVRASMRFVDHRQTSTNKLVLPC